MFQLDHGQFQRREQRFDNRFRLRVGSQLGNNFHNQYYNAPVSQGLNSSSKESDLQVLLRRFDKAQAQTKKGFDDLSGRVTNLSKEVETMRTRHENLRLLVVQLTESKEDY